METKDSRPKELIDNNSHKLIDFYFEFNHLKQLYRQGWLKSGVSKDKCESVADHSFSVALLSFVICEEYFPKLDLSKVLKIALIHDIGESIAGDITPSHNISEEEKYSKELEAVTEIFSGLSNPEKYISLWKEYSENKTPEAKLVKQIDKLEMVLQANIYEKQDSLNLKEFYNSAKEKLKDPEIKEIFSKII